LKGGSLKNEFLTNLPDMVATAMKGKIKRTDCTTIFDDVEYNVSLYRMSDALVRVDFKIPTKKGIK
jgi:hypothetical protein